MYLRHFYFVEKIMCDPHMSDSHITHLSSLISRLLDGTGEYGVITDADKERSKTFDQMTWSQQLELKKIEVKKYSIGDKVRFTVGGQNGLLLYGIVDDDSYEYCICVRGDDGGHYVCSPFGGIHKCQKSNI